MKYAIVWLLSVCVSACAGTETGNPPAEPVIEPNEGGEPDLEHTSYYFDPAAAIRGYTYGVRFTSDAFPADVQSVTGTVLEAGARPDSFTFDGDSLTVGFNQEPPVVLRTQPVGSEGIYASSDLFVDADGSLALHTPVPDCLRMSRKDLIFVPADVIEPIAVVLQNDCESEQIIDWSMLGDSSLVDVLSSKPILVEAGGSAALELLPASDEPGSLTILVDPGGGLEQRRAISVRLLSP